MRLSPTRGLPGAASRGSAAVGPLQLTWDRGGLFAWQPGGRRNIAAVAQTVALVTRAVIDDQVGSVRVVATPGGSAEAWGVRLTAAAFAQAVRREELDPEASPSVRWFAALATLAREIVGHGMACPAVEVAGGAARARWQPTPTPGQRALLAELEATMPPVCAALGGEAVTPSAAGMLDAFVHDLATWALAARGWRPAAPSGRDPSARAVRTVAALLAGRQAAAVVADDAEQRAYERISSAFDRIRRRAVGEPVLGARLRLSMPPADDEQRIDDEPAPTDEAPPHGWPLRAEVFDVDAPERWCTSAEVAARAPVALTVVGAEGHLDLLDAAVADVCARAASVVPVLRERWGVGEAQLTLEEAAELLERSGDLDAAGVPVLVPERLARRRPAVRATARPAGSGEPGRLGRDALVSWEMVVDGRPVPDDVVRRAAEAGSTLVLVGGRWVRLDPAGARHALESVQRHRAEHSRMSTIELLGVAAALGAEGGTDELDAAPVRAGGWLGQLLVGLRDETLADGVVPPEFTATLRPYQRRGLGWLQFLERVGFGGCLADDMGLGKTPTTLAHLAGRPGPHLVVCPLSVVRNWQAEAARFTPLARVLVHHGSGRGRDDDLAAAIGAHDIVITTYQLLVRDHRVLAAQLWTTVVFDEAQAVKNPHTKAARAARHLHAGHVVALTGTPVENRLGELWAILDLTTPGLLGTEQSFRDRFAVPIERRQDARATAALRTLTRPFVLRRTKADRSLVPDLPDKVEQIAWAQLTREQASMYQGVVDQLLRDAAEATGIRRKGLVLAALTRLKQICNHPAHALRDGSRLPGRSGKLARFDELVADLLEADERALVFTQFREMGDLLVQHIGDRFDVRVPFLHGGVAKARRDAMVDRFQSGDAPPLLLVSLKAGGTGLNLTAASRVVHYDRWWNPAVEDQATDRAWRIGQRNAVFVHKLVCQGTVEERISTLIDDKRALASAVVGTSGENWLSELSTDDLRRLVVLDGGAVHG